MRDDIRIQRLVLMLGMLTVAGATLLRGQERLSDDEWCDSGTHSRHDQERYCEVREFQLDARSTLRVDGRTNGGISVKGWDKNEFLIRARITTRADDYDEAKDIASGIKLDRGQTIRAEGPGSRRHRSWSVSYRVFVPRNTNLDLMSTNGGVVIEGVNSNMDFQTTNGGIHLSGVAGKIRGRTTNGGLDIELDGDRWQGDGLDVQTTNGGVNIVIPKGYNARLETGTVNGGMTFDFPITVQGSFRRRLSTTLGSGGALVRATTTNGGVHLRRR